MSFIHSNEEGISNHLSLTMTLLIFIASVFSNKQTDSDWLRNLLQAKNARVFILTEVYLIQSFNLQRL